MIGRLVIVDLVFDDWRKDGRSVYSSIEGVRLSSGDFHGGTTFQGAIVLDADEVAELKQALAEGYELVFAVRGREL